MNCTHVTGMELIEDLIEPRLILGYRIPDTTFRISLREKRLRGFDIIAGETGVHAIRAIFDDLTYSEWAGQPDQGEALTQKVLLIDHSTTIKPFQGSLM